MCPLLAYIAAFRYGDNHGLQVALAPFMILCLFFWPETKTRTKFLRLRLQALFKLPRKLALNNRYYIKYARLEL